MKFKARIYIRPNYSGQGGYWLSLVCYRVINPLDESGNNYINHDIRFPFLSERESGALEHLERIVNEFDGEGGALLYVHEDNEAIRTIANLIVKKGRSSVLFTYVPDRLSDAEFYYNMGKKYPNPDKSD